METINLFANILLFAFDFLMSMLMYQLIPDMLALLCPLSPSDVPRAHSTKINCAHTNHWCLLPDAQTYCVLRVAKLKDMVRV